MIMSCMKCVIILGEIEGTETGDQNIFEFFRWFSSLDSIDTMSTPSLFFVYQCL